MGDIAAVRRAIRSMEGVKKARSPRDRARDMPKSLRAAVTAKCWECMGDGADGPVHTRQAIRTCTSPGCPLYGLRPYQRKQS